MTWYQWYLLRQLLLLLGMYCLGMLQSYLFLVCGAR